MDFERSRHHGSATPAQLARSYYERSAHPRHHGEWYLAGDRRWLPVHQGFRPDVAAGRLQPQTQTMGARVATLLAPQSDDPTLVLTAHAEGRCFF